MSASYFRRVVLIPAVVFLSALFGGAYGSGREIVEFISRHGPVGGFVAILTIAVAYAVCMFLIYEIARVSRTFEYRGFAEQLLGRAKFLYEILIMLGLLLALAICASAGGALAESHFGFTELMGGFGVLLIIVALTYFGREMVENSMILSVSALGVALVFLLISGLADHRGEIIKAFQSHFTMFDGVGTGLRYALTNCGYLPLLLYSIVDLKSRSETVVTALSAAVVGVIPAIAFHLIFMSAFPEIVDQQLPTYWLVERIMPSFFLWAYVAIVFVLVAQTGVALLQGVVESLDKFMTARFGNPLSRAGHATVSGLAVIAASAFASIGIVQLIIRAYGFLSVAFVLVFYLPLISRGIYLIYRQSKN